MSEFVINGANRLCGEIVAHGSKNSSLPILAATVLTGSECIIHNCPLLSDVDAASEILRSLGCTVKREGYTVTVDPSCEDCCEISEELMHKMRSSVIFLGAMLSRSGRAVLCAPGGCDIGLRPIDMHIKAVKALGARVKKKDERLYFEVPDRLKGAEIKLAFPSVGATENVMLAACTARGDTVLYNAAREPEICDLANFLNSCGAKIYGAGSNRIVISGVDALHSAEHTVIPDRIEAASYLLAAAASKGKVAVKNIIPAHISVLIPIFREMGCEIKLSSDCIRLNAPTRLSSVEALSTVPYPGFPTDIQAPMTAALCTAHGTSVMQENIFESRYKYVAQLKKLGARIKVCGRRAVIEGVPFLTGANLKATDLRGGFALIIAALSARGESRISAIEHIDRGYETPELLLQSLGAQIKRI